MTPMTGSELTVAHLARHVAETPDETKQRARDAVARSNTSAHRAEDVELDAKIRVVHGREIVAELCGDFEDFSREFASFIDRQP